MPPTLLSGLLIHPGSCRSATAPHKQLRGAARTDSWNAAWLGAESRERGGYVDERRGAGAAREDGKLTGLAAHTSTQGSPILGLTERSAPPTCLTATKAQACGKEIIAVRPHKSWRERRLRREGIATRETGDREHFRCIMQPAVLKSKTAAGNLAQSKASP